VVGETDLPREGVRVRIPVACRPHTGLLVAACTRQTWSTPSV
jgi:hypothetical protein